MFYFLFLILFISVSNVYAQGISIGSPATQKSIEVTIDENGKTKVVHEIFRSDQPRELNTIRGQVLNLNVTDLDGNSVEFGETGPPHGVIIFPTRENVLVEYNLEDVLFQEGEVWKWNFLYLHSTKFYFPEDVDLVFVGGDPVHLRGSKGITCHGCQMALEYIINEPTSQWRVVWEDKEFDVLLRTLAETSSFIFDQPSKSISLEIEEANHFVTLVIPLELLWSPYQVYLEDEKILKHEFAKNDTHIWLNVRPESPGTLFIIGTSVVPEFPFFIPLVFALSIVVALQFRNKIILR